MPSAHVDTFARDHLPPPELQPQYLFDLPELQFPERLNCAGELLDRHVALGRGGRVCIRAPGLSWSYAELQDKANRIADVLVRRMGLVPGNRVLLRAPNNPMLAACWFAVVKAGGIAVATMPLLRAKELKAIVEIGRVTHALCDAALAEELRLVEQQAPTLLREVRYFNAAGEGSLEAAMAQASPQFDNVDTAADDTCIFGFTSGTTGVPKATMHFHRDVIAACRCWPRHVLKADADDVFIGSPPLAFTFGLGGLLLFPLDIGASTVLLEKAGPPQLLEGIKEFGASVLFTAPTSYRALAARGAELRGSALRKCVSAGEALPAATRALWKQTTGIEIIDGLGATEMLHIFISHDEREARPGATGRPVPGYRAKVVDGEGRELPPGTVGKLAVQGPTGCRYLADERQKHYVKDGWNLTGDAYVMDADGWFHYQARTDDMIISAGYNIAAPEVEEALLQHPAVAECAVIGVPDAERGQIVKAFVVLRPGHAGHGTMVKALQDFVKQTVAPYKYPRAVEFIDKLPRTPTGKLQRFKLQEIGKTAKTEETPAALSEAGDGRTNEMKQALLPAGWPRPKGYANGIAARGRQIYLAGMIGWDAHGVFHTDDFAGQVRQALQNVVDVLREGGAGPEHIVRMTWYVTDKREYIEAYREIGRAYRDLVGDFDVAMTAVQVAALIEDRAKVEIEVTAVVPD